MSLQRSIMRVFSVACV